MATAQVAKQAEVDLDRLNVFTHQILANSLANGLTEVIHKSSNC
jgi:hypothetical protein